MNVIDLSLHNLKIYGLDLKPEAQSLNYVIENINSNFNIEK